MDEFEITYYKKGDYKKLISLWEGSYLAFKPLGRDNEENIENEIERGCGIFIFANHNGKPVGSALITHDGRKGWINRVCVVPQYRKKGIARMLVEHGESWLTKQGIGIYACLIEGNNEVSFEAFKNMGYIPFEGIHYLTKRAHPDI